VIFCDNLKYRNIIANKGSQLYAPVKISYCCVNVFFPRERTFITFYYTPVDLLRHRGKIKEGFIV